jgi:hypothetical protein|tara:strand:- start:228 stop:377 length:150 start_codon:yes stop_codon:yes gene_type:complete
VLGVEAHQLGDLVQKVQRNIMLSFNKESALIVEAHQLEDLVQKVKRNIM